ncbi:hypothetical protein HDV03_003172 [Kappamyces sp. JEL0829]|nr:hypothetical protein HDV03_003172 [Kappamyces sp. JEL0829]
MSPTVVYSCHGCTHSQPLALLYWCQTCLKLECEQCVRTEIACTFCPMCLFEVPSTSIRAERGCCGRNCFYCPVCIQTPLAIQPVGEESDQPMKYKLECSVCDWDSLAVGLLFDRPTGLVAQIHQLQHGSKQDVVEFMHRKEHLEKTAVHFAKMEQDALQKKRFRSLHGPRGQLRGPPLAPPLYASSFKEDDIVNAWSRIPAPHDEIATLKQRMCQTNQGIYPSLVSELYPLRVLLRTRQSKQCRFCPEFLVKPEAKAQSIQFLTKSTGYSHIPQIVISETAQGQTRLVVTNPTASPLSVRHQIPAENGYITQAQFNVEKYILAPHGQQALEMSATLADTAPHSHATIAIDTTIETASPSQVVSFRACIVYD